VILVATKDAGDDANFLKSNTERLELEAEGHEGDQNYEIPAGTDLTKFRTVSIYCERFNANFGAAPPGEVLRIRKGEGEGSGRLRCPIFS